MHCGGLKVCLGPPQVWCRVIDRYPGFRLSNENDIRIVQRWKKVTSANIVTIHNAWTTTKFGDSCKDPPPPPARLCNADSYSHRICL